MKKMETSGVVMFGVCEVQTKRCVAKDGAPITMVWAVKGKKQVNVCGACLNEQLLNGQWQIDGARPTAFR